MNRSLLFAAAIGLALLRPARAADETGGDVIHVMSYNLWIGGDAGKQPLEKSAEVIRRAGADVVGLQETAGESPTEQKPDNAAKIAKLLGWNCVDQGGGAGIISRHKIVATTPKKWGVTLQLPGGRRVHHFNAHFHHQPYQPYQLLGIPYGDAPFLKTAEEAIAAAKATDAVRSKRRLWRN